MNFEKLYRLAPASARKTPSFVPPHVGFLPSGEAMPATGPAAPLGDTRNRLTPPSLREAEKAAGGPDRPASQKTPDEVRKVVQRLRAERYRLLSSAKAVLVEAGHRSGLEHAHNFHRTAKCTYIPCAHLVAVRKAKSHSSAFYSGLTICGSVWVCPVCSAKVQERRREEISKAIDWVYAEGAQPLLVTLTFPHGRHQKLGQLLELQAKALALMRQGAPWRRFKAAVGYRGVIRSLEVTHGENGWHPHTHELWICRAEADAEGMAREVLKRWESACIRVGLLQPDKLEAFRLYAVDVKGWCSAGDYLAKQDSSKHWGADRELAKGGGKAGKSTGCHPFGLLAKAADGDRRSARLFLAYAIAMKGKRQLLWSAGLKAAVGVAEKTDEQLAEEQREDADLLGLLTPADWERVRHFQRRAQVLDAAERGGWKAVQAELASLARRAGAVSSPGAHNPPGKGPPEAPQRAPEASAERPPGQAPGGPSESAGGPPEGPPGGLPLPQEVLGEHFELKKPIICLAHPERVGEQNEIQPSYRKEEPPQHRNGRGAQHACSPDAKPTAGIRMVYAAGLAPGHSVRQKTAAKSEELGNAKGCGFGSGADFFSRQSDRVARSADR